MFLLYCMKPNGACIDIHVLHISFLNFSSAFRVEALWSSAVGCTKGAWWGGGGGGQTVLPPPPPPGSVLKRSPTYELSPPSPPPRPRAPQTPKPKFATDAEADSWEQNRKWVMDIPESRPMSRVAQTDSDLVDCVSERPVPNQNY